MQIDTTQHLLRFLARLIEESGGVADHADLAAWLDEWLAKPLPEFLGMTPAQAMVDESGLRQVETLLERMRGGLPA
jgi:hypothetical protein